MFVTKIILFYLSISMIGFSFFVSMSHNSETEEDRKTRGPFPIKIIKTVFLIGCLILAVAIFIALKH